MMIAPKDIRRKARQVLGPQVLGPLAGAALIAYFGYHAVQGDRGLVAWWNLRHEIEKADFELDAVTRERQQLEHRVSLLRPESLDRDMLEERARAMLGAVHGEDLIVPEPPSSRPLP